MSLQKALERRAMCAILTYDDIPPVLEDFRNREWNTPKKWKSFVKDLTEAIYQRFWFYYPVLCPGGKRAKSLGGERYLCPNGTVKTFQRFMNVKNFYFHRYGRGGEFAAGLYAILWHLGFDVKLVLAHWDRGSHGKHEVHVEIKDPWKGRWIPLDPSYPKGFGHVFPATRDGKSTLIKVSIPRNR